MVPAIPLNLLGQTLLLSLLLDNQWIINLDKPAFDVYKRIRIVLLLRVNVSWVTQSCSVIISIRCNID